MGKSKGIKSGKAASKRPASKEQPKNTSQETPNLNGGVKGTSKAEEDLGDGQSTGLNMTNNKETTNEAKQVDLNEDKEIKTNILQSTENVMNDADTNSHKVMDDIPTTDSSELKALREELDRVEAEREEIQEEYENLLEKVGTIKEKLGDRFKDIQAEAEAAKKEADQFKNELKNVQEELKRTKQELKNELESHKIKSSKIKEESQRDYDALKKELDHLKSAARISESETEVMRKQLVAQKIMFDQELLNEKLAKESIEIENAELHQKIDETEALALQSSQTCELQETALAKLTSELRKLEIESSEQVSTAKKELMKIEAERDAVKQQLDLLLTQHDNISSQMRNSTDLVAKYQQEAKENQLLIGKLRHEAVILNDHLTQALRVIRKDSEGGTVDKELVSNLFVQYVTCPLQDTKKFEILQVIANFLNWSESRRRNVGLLKQEIDQELPPTQMVGFVGKLAEYLESKRH